MTLTNTVAKYTHGCNSKVVIADRSVDSCGWICGIQVTFIASSTSNQSNWKKRISILILNQVSNCVRLGCYFKLFHTCVFAGMLMLLPKCPACKQNLVFAWICSCDSKWSLRYNYSMTYLH